LGPIRGYRGHRTIAIGFVREEGWRGKKIHIMGEGGEGGEQTSD